MGEKSAVESARRQLSKRNVTSEAYVVRAGKDVWLRYWLPWFQPPLRWLVIDGTELRVFHRPTAKDVGKELFRASIGAVDYVTSLGGRRLRIHFPGIEALFIVSSNHGVPNTLARLEFAREQYMRETAAGGWQRTQEPYPTGTGVIDNPALLDNPVDQKKPFWAVLIGVIGYTVIALSTAGLVVGGAAHAEWVPWVAIPLLFVGALLIKLANNLTRKAVV